MTKKVDEKVDNIEYAKRLRKVSAMYGKQGYYTRAKYFRDRATSMEAFNRMRQAEGKQ